MTEATLPRGFGAVPAPNRLGWFAWYQAPGIGVRWITIENAFKSENGKRVKRPFPTEVEAMIAAARAKDRAEDRGREPLSRAAKVFKPAGQGRHRRMESAR